MSAQRGRKKLTREEKAKRNVRKGDRRRAVNAVRQAMREAEETRKKAERIGIELPDTEDQRRYG